MNQNSQNYIKKAKIAKITKTKKNTQNYEKRQKFTKLNKNRAEMLNSLKIEQKSLI